MATLKTTLGRAFAVSRAFRAGMHGRAVIVAFHSITAHLPEDPVTRTERDFRLFCDFFRANFDVISLGQLLDRLVDREPLSGTLAITFDDGYRDNYEVAAPILSRFGLPATFFVSSHLIGSNTVPRWERDAAEPRGWMSWEQVRDLDAHGFEIGAHTQTHVDLGSVDDGTASAEIRGCRDDIRRQLGKAPDLFAYPFGAPQHISEANRRRVVDAGFRCCLSCYGGLLHAGDSPFTAHRVPVSPWFRTPEQFGCEVLLGRA